MLSPENPMMHKSHPLHKYKGILAASTAGAKKARPKKVPSKLVGSGRLVGLWRAHRKAGDKMLATMQERPIRPWHRLRVQRAMDEYRRTLDAIPMPAEEPNT